MASPAGLEPATHSLGNCCSILLSYGDRGKEYPAAAVGASGLCGRLTRPFQQSRQNPSTLSQEAGKLSGRRFTTARCENN